MTKKSGGRSSEEPQDMSAIERFFQAVESRTDDAMHRRLVRAAKKKDPAGALEAELGRVVQEILDEA